MPAGGPRGAHRASGRPLPRCRRQSHKAPIVPSPGPRGKPAGEKNLPTSNRAGRRRDHPVPPRPGSSRLVHRTCDPIWPKVSAITFARSGTSRPSWRIWRHFSRAWLTSSLRRWSASASRVPARFGVQDGEPLERLRVAGVALDQARELALFPLAVMVARGQPGPVCQDLGRVEAGGRQVRHSRPEAVNVAGCQRQLELGLPHRRDRRAVDSGSV